MIFLLTFLLVVAATAFLMGGLAGAGTPAFIAAAVCSLLAVLATLRRISGDREKTRTSDLPGVGEPDWSGNLYPDEPTGAGKQDREGVPVSDAEIGIDGFDDLVAAEVLPCLETLSIEQLRGVIARERTGLNRLAVIERASRLIGLTTGEIKLDMSKDVLGVADPSRSRAQERTQERTGPDLSI